MRTNFLAALAALAPLAWAGPAPAEEGMWTFDHFPSAQVKASLGVDITAAWLDHVRGAAVRLSDGCSASVVSGAGLVLTNNHCVADCAQNLSSPGQDDYQSGFLALARGEEKLCPGMQAEILIAITDVTGPVAAAGVGLTGEALVKARTAVSSTLEAKACAGQPKLRCEVVDFYHGGQHKLYVYRKYADVRLVFSPGVQTAFFGGDPDNFNFPRYDLDCAFLRLYDDGQPAATPDHLRWNNAAPTANAPVFVAGDPGGTDRELTLAQLQTQRAVSLPMLIAQYAERRGRLIRFSQENAENRRIAAQDLFSVENTFKVLMGRLAALNDPDLMAGRAAAEAELQAAAKANRAKLGPGFDDPWADIAGVQIALQALYPSYQTLERGPADSKLFNYAKALVRAAQERQKPSPQRLPGYGDSQLPLLQKQLLDAKPVAAPLEQLELEFWLSKAREYLTADDPNTKLLLGDDSPEALSARLAFGSRLGDRAVRKALWDGGAAAVNASPDPMIQYMLRIDPAARQVLAQYDAQVKGPTTRAAEVIARARFMAFGERQYPDATFTLRLSAGRIEGWTWRGRAIAPFTTFAGLYARANGAPPFALDPRWLAAKDRLDLAAVFDIATSNDIIGGNSGSPLIDADGAVIGAVFDGNIHSLGGDYGYDAATNRAVAVSAQAISEALTKVYGAAALNAELTARAGQP